MTTRTRRANLPPTPYIVPRVAADAHTVAEALPEASVDADGDHDMSVSRPTGPQVTTKKIRLSADVISQTLKAARVLVTRIVFTKNAMVSVRKKKQRLIDRVIEDSVPQFFGPNGEFSFIHYLIFYLPTFAAVFESFITSAHRTKVLSAFSAKRGKLIDFARFGVCDAYELFPPRGHVSTAGEYRTARIDRFIHGDDPLLFMHDFFVDAVRLSFKYLILTQISYSTIILSFAQDFRIVSSCRTSFASCGTGETHRILRRPPSKR